jgi:hypothetical protein
LRSFAEAKQAASTIDGMLGSFSMELMDAILSFQEEERIGGHIIEFGVYKGRSAAILGNHVQPSERVILVDIADHLDRAGLANILGKAEFVLSSSEDFPTAFPGYRSLRGHCRFVHIDSSHAYRTTFAELAIAEELLAPGGVIVLDDFTNLNYSQILAATYKYLYTAQTQLMVFLVTEVKAYLCRKDDYERFGNFVLHRLLDEMKSRGNEQVGLSCTDADPEYRAFHLRELRAGDEKIMYGSQLYSHYYKSP